MKPEDITYVTTCKGRLHHLKKSLPKIVDQGLGGIIVVDFDCPDKSGQWVSEHFPFVQVVKVNEQLAFDYSRSRNIGGQEVITKWIAFFDADVLVSANFFRDIAKNLKEGSYYLPNNEDGNTWGSFLVEKKLFDKVGGYDEAIKHWGGVDTALYNVLSFIGARQETYDGRLVEAIQHADSARTAFTNQKDIKFAKQLSTVYEICKMDLMLIEQTLLDLEFRITLRQTVHNTLVEMIEKSSGTGRFSIELPSKTLVRPSLGQKNTPIVKRALNFEIQMDPLKNQSD